MTTPLTYSSTLPDKVQFHRLYETTGWNVGYQRSADKLYEGLCRSWYVIGAYAGEDLVGFGRVLSDGVLHAFIVEMIVDPAYQGRGIGGHIVQDMVQHCLMQGITDIQLFCAKGKTGFYEKQGFVPRPDNAPGMQYRATFNRSG